VFLPGGYLLDSHPRKQKQEGVGSDAESWGFGGMNGSAFSLHAKQNTIYGKTWT